MMSLKNYIPWWGKITAKLFLSRLPIKYQMWKKLGLFELGLMDQASYAYNIFKQNFEQFKKVSSQNKNSNSEQGFIGLELGPGDSLSSALIVKAFGGSKSYLVDAGDFASRDMETYYSMAAFLSDKGLSVPDEQRWQTLEAMLTSCSAHYMTSGLSSLRTLPDQSVDFIWSHAVLEHIRRSDFLEIVRELRRIIRNNGVCSHQVDLKDHLGGALNNLRFSEKIWESDFIANSGFYTNRIQYSQMLDMFQKAGFDVEVVEVDQWARMPTPKSKLSQEFKHIADEELCISGFSVLLKPVKI